jgi:hypothetical protein
MKNRRMARVKTPRNPESFEILRGNEAIVLTLYSSEARDQLWGGPIVLLDGN